MIKTVIVIADPDLPQEEYKRLITLVSPEKRERLNRYAFFRDARNSLIGDILIRSEIGKYTGIQTDRLSFSVNENGKPFLSAHPQIHFNISHTGDRVAFAMDDASIGIDIEQIKPVDLKLADRFFHVEEKAYILSCPAEHRDRAFYEIWTKKESFIKRDGRGLSIPLPSFSVLGEQAEPLFFHRVFEDTISISHVCTTKNVVSERRIMTVPEWFKSM